MASCTVQYRTVCAQVPRPRVCPGSSWWSSFSISLSAFWFIYFETIKYLQEQPSIPTYLNPSSHTTDERAGRGQATIYSIRPMRLGPLHSTTTTMRWFYPLPSILTSPPAVMSPPTLPTPPTSAISAAAQSFTVLSAPAAGDVITSRPCPTRRQTA
jgi:hypothetical protein